MTLCPPQMLPSRPPHEEPEVNVNDWEMKRSCIRLEREEAMVVGKGVQDLP